MSINNILLTCAALFPAVALGIYVFKKDRVEREPLGLLALLLLLGCVICVPVIVVGGLLDDVISTIFSLFAVEVDGTFLLSGGMFTLYTAVDNFIGVALVEEGFKFLAMFLVTRKNKNFNCLFDGIVYAVFVSLGFAGLENILYVFQYGWVTALMRAVLSVPGHVFFGVLMGYHYSVWKLTDQARELEYGMKSAGLVDKSTSDFSGTPSLVRCLVMPILAHGFYDFCLSMELIQYTLIFYAFVAFLYYHCFKRIREMSRFDIENVRISVAMLLRKYPHLKPMFQPENQAEAPCETGVSSET